MEFLLCALLGYFVGTVNPAYLLGKIKGFDIRKKGSGNAGASNALILFGKVIGVVCAFLDIAKAYFAILLTTTLFPDFSFAFTVTGVACILGHIFPFYMHFKGGKGLACLGGMILYFDYRVFLIMLVLAVVLALVTDYICFVPISASAAFPFVYWGFTKHFAGALILAISAVVIFLRHLENLKRIRKGTEMHLSYIWKPEQEMSRMMEHLTEDSAVVEDYFSAK